jgi:hypothetical protein
MLEDKRIIGVCDSRLAAANALLMISHLDHVTAAKNRNIRPKTTDSPQYPAANAKNSMIMVADSLAII